MCVYTTFAKFLTVASRHKYLPNILSLRCGQRAAAGVRTDRRDRALCIIIISLLAPRFRLGMDRTRYFRSLVRSSLYRLVRIYE